MWDHWQGSQWHGEKKCHQVFILKGKARRDGIMHKQEITQQEEEEGKHFRTKAVRTSHKVPSYKVLSDKPNS